MENLNKTREEELRELAEDVLTVEEAAQILKVGRVAVCRALTRGTLPGTKIGGQWRISKTRLMAYLRGEEGTDKAGKKSFAESGADVG